MRRITERVAQTARMEMVANENQKSHDADSFAARDSAIAGAAVGVSLVVGVGMMAVGFVVGNAMLNARAPMDFYVLPSIYVAGGVYYARRVVDLAKEIRKGHVRKVPGIAGVFAGVAGAAAFLGVMGLAFGQEGSDQAGPHGSELRAALEEEGGRLTVEFQTAGGSAAVLVTGGEAPRGVVYPGAAPPFPNIEQQPATVPRKPLGVSP